MCIYIYICIYTYIHIFRSLLCELGAQRVLGAVRSPHLIYRSDSPRTKNAHSNINF